MTTTGYADLEIRILERQEGGYPVELTLAGEREFPRGFLPPDILPWVSSGQLEVDGRRMLGWFSADDNLQTAWAEARGAYPAHRVRLRIDEGAPELHTLPWELLQVASESGATRFMAAADSTPFSRYLSGRWQPGSPTLKRPIKILVAIANPENLASDFNLEPLDVEAEWAGLQEVTEGLEVELTLLPQPCTLTTLEQALREGYHVLHFIGHGRASEKQQKAALFLADEANRVSLVGEEEFAAMLDRMLADAAVLEGDRLRLVFLASCETAKRSSADAYRGFAPRLVAAGVPAVLAMQDLITVDTARVFARTYYQQLLDHGLVDLACNQARAAILTADLPGGGVPVLYMRLRMGRLFGLRGRILGDRTEGFWSTLLRNIEDGECTPFLGSGVGADLLPDPRELAQTLAHEYNYPFPTSQNLARVSQFVGTMDNRRLRKDVIREMVEGFQRRMGLTPEDNGRAAGLAESIAAADWSARCQDLFETEIHHQLADLGLPLYVTTNFDNFMTLALEAKGRSPHREVVAWREALAGAEDGSHHTLQTPASREEPVVLHLFGTDDDLLSMVLTEDDYLDYLARISRDYEYLLPTDVNDVLASTTLLFVGYRLDDLDLKVILRGLLANLDLARWGMLHVAVQVEASLVDQDKHQEVIRYFQKYFSDLKIDVYWGSTRQFIADLHSRWLEHRDG
jgi:hypothetical protein